MFDDILVFGDGLSAGFGNELRAGFATVGVFVVGLGRLGGFAAEMTINLESKEINGIW